MEKTLIYGIIALIIIAASGFFIYNFAKEAYSGFNVWDDLTESEKSEVVDTFNALTDKMEKCRIIDDNNCICKEVIPSFPYIFRKETSVKFTEERNAKLKTELLFNEKNVGIEKEIDNMIISSTGDEQTNVHTLSSDSYLTGKKKFKVLYPHILKKESKSVLYFITSTIPRGDNILEGYPICMSDRAEAISKFELFLSKLSTEANMTIDLPSDYKIYYERRVIKLMYNNEAVRNIVDEKLELVGKIDYTDNIKCDNPITPDYLASGDNINIEKTASGFCIVKI